MLARVVIVGAGPAGLFAANELAESFDVVILEMRNFVGGSGLHSDGKLNFHPFIGGDLTEFMSEEEAWKLVYYIRDLFHKFGVEGNEFDEKRLMDLETRAIRAGIRFIKIMQGHIGSDYLPKVMGNIQRYLEARGVEIKLGTRALSVEVKDGRVIGVKTDRGYEPCDYLLLAPGRIGSRWLIDLSKRLRIKMRFNPIDIGVRVEVPNEVMNEVIYEYKCWDPKFHIRTPSYDDFVRTFCVCPSGFVVKEEYEDNIFGVNGHSMRDTVSNNTNFALLARIHLTKPLENTTQYGRRIAQLTNTLGGGKPILQRLGDLRNFKRSTWERINRSYVEPTLKDVTPGDIAMAYPERILKDLMEGMEMLDKVMPGINSDSTLLYAPEIKFYAMRIETDRSLRTSIPNLFVAGDGAGVSRGIVGAAATGIIAARGIKSGPQ
ncbi:FAD-dependent oxidoreductase [Candidatus Bathyarchaeota archaeon]|nr:MAG: FAD-dependent oxidoreductase [Candidatus Bathyarchaeota archaeon]